MVTLPHPLGAIPVTMTGEALAFPTEAEALRAMLAPLTDAARRHRDAWRDVPPGCDDPEWWVQSKRAAIKAEVMAYLLKMTDEGF